MQRRPSAATIEAATRRLAVECDQSRGLRPERRRPRHEDLREELRVDAVHRDAQPAGARQAVVIGQEAAQETEIVLTPLDDLVEIVAGADRPAHHQQQHLRQRMRHPPGFPIVRRRRETIRQHPQSRSIPEFHPNLHRSDGSHQIPSPRGIPVDPSSGPWRGAEDRLPERQSGRQEGDHAIARRHCDPSEEGAGGTGQPSEVLASEIDGRPVRTHLDPDRRQGGTVVVREMRRIDVITRFGPVRVSSPIGSPPHRRRGESGVQTDHRHVRRAQLLASSPIWEMTYDRASL